MFDRNKGKGGGKQSITFLGVDQLVVSCMCCPLKCGIFNFQVVFFLVIVSCRVAALYLGFLYTTRIIAYGNNGRGEQGEGRRERGGRVDVVVARSLMPHQLRL